MGARTSKEMDKAKKLILEQGLTQAQAAKITGLSKAAISMSAWYRDFKKNVKQTEKGNNET